MRRRRILSLVGALLVVAAACSSGEVQDAGPPGSAADAGTVAGTSSTTSTTLRVQVGPAGVTQPRFAGRHVLAFTNDTLTSFDADTLDPEWTSEPCRNPTWPGPYYVRVADVPVIQCASSYRGLDPETGRTRWEFDPQVEVNQLRLGGSTMTIASTGRLRAVDLQTGTVRWDVSAPEVGTSVSGDSVYEGGRSGLVSIDAQSGAPRWRIDWDVTDEMAAGDTLYVWAWKGPKPFLLSVGVQDGAVHWQQPLADDNKTKTAFVGISEHAVVVERLGAERGYEAFDRTDGHLLWSHVGEIAEGVTFEMSVAAHAVVLCSPNGEVTALDDRTATHAVRLGESVDAFCPASGDLVASVVGKDQQELHVTTIPPL